MFAHVTLFKVSTTMAYQRRWENAIAYRRVSTERQGESGVGFEGQKAAIEEYAKLDRYRITNWFEDVGSGRGPRNFIDRSGIQEAVQEAKRLRVPIIVSGFDRVSREAKTIEELVRSHGITIISAGDGKVSSPVILASKAARAQKEGEFISQTTKEGLARKKAEGVLLGNRTNLPEAQTKGVERKKEIADETIHKIAAVLDELADRNVTARELVEELDKRGILTSTKRPWTIPAIRRPLRAARRLIEERNLVDHKYKNHPLFGRFG